MFQLNNDIVKSYKKLIYSIIKEYCNEYNKEDLYQAGLLGLIKASKTYDKEKSNAKFSSFAYKSILGEVLKYLREDRNIRISRDIISDYKKIYKTKEYIYQTYGKNISNKELSKIINIDEKRINEVLLYNQETRSLDNEISSNSTLKDIIPFKDKSIDYIDLKDAFKDLTNEEKELILERYYYNKSQTEIAKEKNISQVKVYRLERKTLDKMKDKIA
jgi:RNA polymerase sporulation-specific sigma factor